MRQLFNVLAGSLVIMGYFAFESIIYGTALWFVWNISFLGTFTNLGVMSWIQGVTIIFIVKILRFDAAKQENRAPIIIQQKKEDKE